MANPAAQSSSRPDSARAFSQDPSFSVAPSAAHIAAMGSSGSGVQSAGQVPHLPGSFGAVSQPLSSSRRPDGAPSESPCADAAPHVGALAAGSAPLGTANSQADGKAADTALAAGNPINGLVQSGTAKGGPDGRSMQAACTELRSGGACVPFASLPTTHSDPLPASTSVPLAALLVQGSTPLQQNSSEALPNVSASAAQPISMAPTAVPLLATTSGTFPMGAVAQSVPMAPIPASLLEVTSGASSMGPSSCDVLLWPHPHALPLAPAAFCAWPAIPRPSSCSSMPLLGTESAVSSTPALQPFASASISIPSYPQPASIGPATPFRPLADGSSSWSSTSAPHPPVLTSVPASTQRQPISLGQTPRSSLQTCSIAPSAVPQVLDCLTHALSEPPQLSMPQSLSEIAYPHAFGSQTPMLGCPSTSPLEPGTQSAPVQHGTSSVRSRPMATQQPLDGRWSARPMPAAHGAEPPPGLTSGPPAASGQASGQQGRLPQPAIPAASPCGDAWAAAYAASPSGAEWQAPHAADPFADAWTVRHAAGPSRGGWHAPHATNPNTGGWPLSHSAMPTAGGWSPVPTMPPSGHEGVSGRAQLTTSRLPLYRGVLQPQQPQPATAAGHPTLSFLPLLGAAPTSTQGTKQARTAGVSCSDLACGSRLHAADEGRLPGLHQGQILAPRSSALGVQPMNHARSRVGASAERGSGTSLADRMHQAPLWTGSSARTLIGDGVREGGPSPQPSPAAALIDATIRALSGSPDYLDFGL